MIQPTHAIGETVYTVKVPNSAWYFVAPELGYESGRINAGDFLKQLKASLCVQEWKISAYRVDAKTVRYYSGDTELINFTTSRREAEATQREALQSILAQIEKAVLG